MHVRKEAEMRGWKLRIMVLGLVLAFTSALGTGDAHAICGFPAIVVTSVFGGGTAWVALYNPAPPFNFTGASSVGLGGVPGPPMHNTWLAAISNPPPNFLLVVTPIGAGCPFCVLPPAGQGFCPPALATAIFP
jgi:hypothetical protein